MTGQDFQDKLDAIVRDLQTSGKGQTIELTFRDNTNSATILPLSSTAGGVVDVGQLAAVQAFVDAMKPTATDYETVRAPVQTALEVLADARVPHEPIIAAASAARIAVTDALLADPVYQTAKTDLETARSNPLYVAASSEYKDLNVSENFAELTRARGKYVE